MLLMAIPIQLKISHWTSFLLTSGIENNAGMNIWLLKCVHSSDCFLVQCSDAGYQYKAVTCVTGWMNRMKISKNNLRGMSSWHSDFDSSHFIHCCAFSLWIMRKRKYA